MNTDSVLNVTTWQREAFKKRPTAFMLLHLIAERIKRNDDHPDKDLGVGEARIGDWESYCESRRCYRTDQQFLIKYGLIRVQKATNTGTIVQAVTPNTFGITEKISATTSANKVANKVATKTANEKKESDIKKEIYNNNNNISDKSNKKDIYADIVNHFNKVMGTRLKTLPVRNADYWTEIYTVDEIKEAISHIMYDDWMKSKGGDALNLLFRKESAKGDQVDRIGKLLDKKQPIPDGWTDEEWAILHAPLPKGAKEFMETGK